MDSTPTPTTPSQSDPTSLPSTASAADLKLTAVSSLIDHLHQRATGGTDAEPTVSDGLSTDLETAEQNSLVQRRLGLASSLFAALQAKHAPTAAHCLRVALASSSLGLKLDLSDDQRDELEVAALLHDIGKIGIPDHILLKPEHLTREESGVIDCHRQTAEQILMGCCASPGVLSTVKYASAWWDGSRTGFDRCGAELPQEARLVSILDAFDSMTTDQVYRRAMSRELAMAELFACAGTQFDPTLVRQFSELLAADPVMQITESSKSWFNKLVRERPNTFWTWDANQERGLASPSSSDALFHEKLLESMHDGVVFVDTNMHIVFWNRAAERLTGVSASNALQQRWSSRLLNMRDENGAVLDDQACPITHTLTSHVQSFRRLTVPGRDGERLCIDVHAAPVIGSDGVIQGATLLLHDASPQVTMEQRIETLHLKATRDPLTNIANRAEFDRTLVEFVESHLQRGLPGALLICDIDHFKHTNDTYGHQAGDQVLISFSSLLQRSAETADLVARYGGEEFVMLCPNCDNATVTQRAEKIRRELEDTPHSCIDNRSITASFGVTEIQAGDTAETMLRRADRALLSAKENGRNRVVQLGTGIPADPERRRRNVFRRWFQPTPSTHLLHETLVTAAPLAVTMEKLRGFMSDHHAEIISTEDGKLRLQITKRSPSDRRAADRPIGFFLSLQFLEKQIKERGSETDTTHTIIRVSIQLVKSRDRRFSNAYDRARQLFASLKSYFMAQAFDGSLESDEAAANHTLFRRLLTLLHPRPHHQ